jgi:hypothetical protein
MHLRKMSLTSSTDIQPSPTFKPRCKVTLLLESTEYTPQDISLQQVTQVEISLPPQETLYSGFITLKLIVHGGSGKIRTSRTEKTQLAVPLPSTTLLLAETEHLTILSALVSTLQMFPSETLPAQPPAHSATSTFDCNINVVACVSCS